MAPLAHDSESCGPTTGDVTTTLLAPPFDPLLDRSRAIWSAGDFGRIATGFAPGAAAFVDRLRLVPGDRVLDVACGTGNLAIPAARRGAVVTGLDIAPNLIDAARRASLEAALDIRFDVGAAERLPYPDAAFDVVISMFGVMFAARPEQALAELLRVTRPGGRIALANWMPDGLVGRMLRLHAAHVPPPPDTPSPLAWGDEAVMRRRLEPLLPEGSTVRFTPRTIAMTYPLPPEGVVDLFREYYGPSVRTFGMLDEPRRRVLATELTRHWTIHNTATDGTTAVDAEYVDVHIDLAER